MHKFNKYLTGILANRITFSAVTFGVKNKVELCLHYIEQRFGG